ncbi:MAG: T9SS type A sorting domain-containing protein [bacterium]|nr:T9SS type A sorting domain-containing protein [bacterium]
MKKYLLVFLIIAGTDLFASAPDTLWTRTFGGTDTDLGYSVRQTSDSGFIIAGWTESFGAGRSDVYLIKTNSSGNTLWTKTYGGSNDDFSKSVLQTSDGGYVIVGGTSSYGNADAYLIKTDSSGDTLWTKTYGGTYWERGNSVQSTSSGIDGYIIVGETSSFGAGIPLYSNVYIVRTNLLGDTLWTKIYGGIYNDYGCSIQQTRDKGFIIVGETFPLGTNDGDIYLIRIDSLGDTLWTKTFGGTSFDESHAVQQTMDGGFIVAGTTLSFGPGAPNYCDVYLIRTDSLGDTLWIKNFGGTKGDMGESVLQTPDSGFIIAGATTSFGVGTSTHSNIYLIKTNSSGDTLWTKSFGGDTTEFTSSIQQTFDGGFIIAGWTTSFGEGGDDIYLVRLGKETGIEETSNLKTQNAKLEISQNPFIKSTIIKYQIPAISKVSLAIYDITGSCVKTLINEEKEAGSYSINLDAKELKTGVYFVKLTADTSKTTRKITVIR